MINNFFVTTLISKPFDTILKIGHQNTENYFHFSHFSLDCGIGYFDVSSQHAYIIIINIIIIKHRRYSSLTKMFIFVGSSHRGILEKPSVDHQFSGQINIPVSGS